MTIYTTQFEYFWLKKTRESVLLAYQIAIWFKVGPKRFNSFILSSGVADMKLIIMPILIILWLCVDDMIIVGTSKDSAATIKASLFGESDSERLVAVN